MKTTTLLIALVATTAAANKCPGSDAWVHASMEVSVTADASCAAVEAEMTARVAGQSTGAWFDPHNKGTYTIVKTSSSELDLTRTTGNGKYTDKMIFTFSDDGSGKCTLSGCSESQVTSVSDFSTNYCNLRMLYCGKNEGCHPVKTDFAIQEDHVKPSVGAGKDPSACLKVLDTPSVQLQQVPPQVMAFNYRMALRGASANKTLFKIAEGQCGQATLDAKYASAAEKFAGLQEGTCASQGFTVADGTKTLKVPVLGSITVSLFKKAASASSITPMASMFDHNVDAAIKASTLLAEVDGSDATEEDAQCCQTCDGPTFEKFYSIDTKHGFCGEACMRPSHYRLYKLFEPGLTKATSDTPCADNNYHTYKSTVTHGVPPVTMTLDLYNPDPMYQAAQQLLAAMADTDVATPAYDDGAKVLSTLPKDYADLVTFDKAETTSFGWKDMNDPVMGGLSTSTFKVDEVNHKAVFNGTVAVVPSLKAPGFCNAETTAGYFTKFTDVSKFTHFIAVVRTSTPQYAGFKVSFAADVIIRQFYSYKANFPALADTEDWQVVAIPFSGFSNDWSSYTGDCDTKDPNSRATQHHCCDADHPDVCPTAKNLRDISQIGLWTEGHAGNFHLEIQRLGAANLAA